jgi:hypothetical protein
MTLTGQKAGVRGTSATADVQNLHQPSPLDPLRHHLGDLKYHNSKLVDKAMSTYLAVKGAAMSNIDKQALREEFQYMQEHYSDPADRELVIYIAAEALLDELEAKDKQIVDLKATAAHSNAGWKEAHEQEARAEAAEKRIAEQRGQKRLIGWRMADYTDETADPALAKNWATAVDVLPIFEGDVNTKLSAAAAGKGE